MSAPTNHWKLGAFVLSSFLIAATGVVLLGERAMRTQNVNYTSYFDEAVTGLEVGSPVTFRGVKIGNVSAIDIAADGRHVEIDYTLGVKVLDRLGLAGTTRGKETRITVPDNLRVQLASTGLTGTKYLQIDFFDLASSPAATLPFPVPENYIPGTPSTMKNLEDAVMRGAEMLPLLAQDVSALLAKLDLLLDDVRRSQLPEKAATALVTANQTLLSLQVQLERMKVGELSHEARETLKGVTVMLARLTDTLARLDGEKGLMASVHRASDSLGDLTGGGLNRNLHDTLRDLREAATGIRRLVEALERDPDMLLKGKGKARP